MFKRALIATVLAVLLCSLTALAANEGTPASLDKQQPLGWVIVDSGDWQLDNGKRRTHVDTGTKVPVVAGDRLKLRSKEGSASIALYDEHGTRITCPGNPQCDKPFGQASSPLDAALQPITALFSGRHNYLINASSRPGPVVDAVLAPMRVKECVVSAANGDIDVSPLFRSRASGSITAELEAVDCNNLSAPRAAATQATVEVSERSAKLRSAAPISPGLYNVILMEGTNRTNRQAWMLVASPQSSNDTCQRFAQAEALCEKWRKNSVPEDFVRQFLRASLAVQARGCINSEKAAH